MALPLRDRHKGRKCYIFGSGPSLSRFDCDKLAADGVSICCNASIMAVKRCDYFLFTDPTVMQEKAYCMTIFDKAGIVVAGNGVIAALLGVAFGAAVKERIELPGPGYRRQSGERFDFQRPEDVLINGGCVEVATHYAFLMGCSPIILVGVDLKWDGKRKYFHDRSDETLWPHVAGEERPEHDTSMAEHFGYWQQIKQDNPGLPVFVANPDSRLCELYPAIDLSAFQRGDT